MIALPDSPAVCRDLPWILLTPLPGLPVPAPEQNENSIILGPFLGAFSLHSRFPASEVAFPTAGTYSLMVTILISSTAELKSLLVAEHW